MKNIKILLVLFFIFVLGISISNATTSISSTSVNSSSNGYNEPIIDWSIEFKATLEDWKVYTKWTKYNKDEWFKYYKVVRSQKVSSPVYPDNWYIKYSSDVNFTEYVDYKVPVWLSYYRVCAITKERNRYCSNVVKIIKEASNLVNNIPKSCISWYDGCNTCSVSDWKLGWCTKMACFTNKAPKCLKYKETERPKICTMEYAPVCWQPPMPTCPKGVVCRLQVPNPKTYSNKCMLEWAWAKFLYKWECWNSDKVVCTQDVKKCSDGSYVSRVGPNCKFAQCPIVSGLSDKLKAKADNIAETFIKRLEKKYTDNEKRIRILKLINIKLKKLANKKPKYKDLINYLVYKFEQRANSYGDIFNDLDGILNIYY